MEFIDTINTQLDKIAIKYDINRISTKTYTLDQTLQLLNKIEQINPKIIHGKTKFGVLQNLVYKLNEELCIKNSQSIDHILNEIIVCIEHENTLSRNECAKQIQKILDENYLKSNIKKKLNTLVDLLVKV
jgi:hypothetical protein